MELFQAGYTRTGGTGEGAGWKVVAPSYDLGSAPLEMFKGIASNVISLTQGDRQLPNIVTGIFEEGDYYFLIRVNYRATVEGGDTRGNAYAHGVVMTRWDYDAMCRQPDTIFGMDDSAMPISYDPEIREYPAIDGLLCYQMNFDDIFSRYGFTVESYRNLILGAINAISGFSQSLCIVSAYDLQDQEIVYKDIMYLIMCGLPYKMRSRVSSFAAPGRENAVNIYFSQEAQGDNVFNMADGSYVGNFSELDHYYFTRIYGTPAFINGTQLPRLWETIDQFAYNTEQDPSQNIYDLDEVEAAFQHCIKKHDGEGIPGELAYELMDKFLNFSLKYDGAETAGYLAELYRLVTERGESVDQQIENRLLEIANSGSDEEHKELLRLINLSEVNYLLYLAKSEEGPTASYERFYEWFTADQARFGQFYALIKEQNEPYLHAYYYDYYLPKTITSYETAQQYIRQEQPNEKAYRRILELLDPVLKEKLSRATGLTGLLECIDVYKSVTTSDKPELLPAFKEKCEAVKANMWQFVDFSGITRADLALAEQSGVSDVVTLGADKVPEAVKVNLLLNTYNYYRSMQGAQSIDELYKLLAGKAEISEVVQPKLVQFLKEDFFANVRYENVTDYDKLMLFTAALRVMHFDPEAWYEKLAEAMPAFERNQMEDYVRVSFLMANPELSQLFVADLDNYLRANAMSTLDLTDTVKKLRMLYHILTGEKHETDRFIGRRSEPHGNPGEGIGQESPSDDDEFGVLQGGSGFGGDSFGGDSFDDDFTDFDSQSAGSMPAVKKPVNRSFGETIRRTMVGMFASAALIFAAACVGRYYGIEMFETGSNWMVPMVIAALVVGILVVGAMLIRSRKYDSLGDFLAEGGVDTPGELAVLVLIPVVACAIGVMLVFLGIKGGFLLYASLGFVAAMIVAALIGLVMDILKK